MKQVFTNPYFKKWALTGCLVAALGFSVSHNKHLGGFASVDMASEENVLKADLATEKGVVPVRYYANGSEKITAMVSKLDAEGKVCTTCENQIVTISGSLEKNRDNIAALNVLLLKALKETTLADKAEKIADKKVTRRNDDDTDVKQDFTDEKLAAIVTRCSKSSDKATRLECESSAFVNLLQKYEDPKDRSQTLSMGKLQSFFKSHIEDALISQVNDARRVTSLIRRGVDLSAKDADKDPKEMRDTVLEHIKSMLGEIPAKFEPLRRRLMTAETNMTNIEARDVQQLYQQAKAQNNPALNQEAMLRHQDLQGFLNNLNSTNYEGLMQNAQSLDGVKVVTLEQYYNQFNSYARNLSQAIAKNPYDFQLPTTTFDSPLNQVNALNNPNGGATQVIILTDANGNRIGRSGGSFPTVNGTPVQIPANQQGGVIMFSQPQTLTPEQRAARGNGMRSQ